MSTAKPSPNKRFISPEQMFASPAEVVGKPDLTFDEKKQILAQWLHDEKLLSTATDENMTGGRPSRIEEIQNAILLLERNAQQDPDTNPPAGKI